MPQLRCPTRPPRTTTYRSVTLSTTRTLCARSETLSSAPNLTHSATLADHLCITTLRFNPAVTPSTLTTGALRDNSPHHPHPPTQQTLAGERGGGEDGEKGCPDISEDHQPRSVRCSIGQVTPMFTSGSLCGDGECAGVRHRQSHPTRGDSPRPRWAGRPPNFPSDLFITDSKNLCEQGKRPAVPPSASVAS